MSTRYYKKENIKSFDDIMKNENSDNSLKCLSYKHEEKNDGYCTAIAYITDLHIKHHISNTKIPRRKDNIIKYIIRIANNLYAETINKNCRILLVGGDISSEFKFCKILIEKLKEIIKKNKSRLKVIITLGNHDFWDFNDNIDNIVSKYRDLLNKNGMYLLYNDLVYLEYDNLLGYYNYSIVNYSELESISIKKLNRILRKARCIIYGGVGFSGYNKEFNAETNNIYRDTINRKTEIQETKKYEKIYNKILPILKKHNSIVLTHMPIKDWCKNSNYEENIVYVNGHTHLNTFNDDGKHRLYLDNQIGYKNKIHIKTLLLDNEYDYFIDYSDGIYENITKEEYRNFYRGKNESMDCNDKNSINEIIMLKKKGYYCFFNRNKNGKLQILDGGTPNNVDKADIQYYFDNLDKMCERICPDLNKYTKIQEKISKLVKSFGGDGEIHGCIINIDFNNHIYVYKSKENIIFLGYYWANDTENKYFYPDLKSLLKDNNYELFCNISKNLIDINSQLAFPNVKALFPHIKVKKEALRLYNEKNIKLYKSKDMYKPSSKIRKMQRLHKNILRIWNEKYLDNANFNDKKELLSNKKLLN